jgi:hypothetical protein
MPWRTSGTAASASTAGTAVGVQLAEHLIERHGPSDHDKARALLHTA